MAMGVASLSASPPARFRNRGGGGTSSASRVVRRHHPRTAGGHAARRTQPACRGPVPVPGRDPTTSATVRPPIAHDGTSASTSASTSRCSPRPRWAIRTADSSGRARCTPPATPTRAH